MKDLLIDLIEWMTTSSGTSSKTIEFGSEISLIGEMWNYFAIVGIAMTLIYFLLEMNRKFALEGGDLTIKSFFAPFLKLMIAVGILAQGDKIIILILGLNNGMANAANGWFSGGSFQEKLNAKMAELTSVFGSWGILNLTAIITPLLLGFIISMVLKLVWWYKGLVYKLEVVFRIGLAPVALADVYSGQNSGAIRYLKGFLALGIYGAALVALPNLSMQLAVLSFDAASSEIDFGTAIWGTLAGFFQIAFVAPFAALSCANAVRTAAKEALGA